DRVGEDRRAPTHTPRSAPAVAGRNHQARRHPGLHRRIHRPAFSSGHAPGKARYSPFRFQQTVTGWRRPHQFAVGFSTESITKTGTEPFTSNDGFFGAGFV